MTTLMMILGVCMVGLGIGLMNPGKPTSRTRKLKKKTSLSDSVKAVILNTIGWEVIQKVIKCVLSRLKHNRYLCDIIAKVFFYEHHSRHYSAEV